MYSLRCLDNCPKLSLSTIGLSSAIVTPARCGDQGLDFLLAKSSINFISLPPHTSVRRSIHEMTISSLKFTLQIIQCYHFSKKNRVLVCFHIILHSTSFSFIFSNNFIFPCLIFFVMKFPNIPPPVPHLSKFYLQEATKN